MSRLQRKYIEEKFVCFGKPQKTKNRKTHQVFCLLHLVTLSNAPQVFQFCKCLKLLGNIMILVVLGLVGLSYYPVVVAIYGPIVLESGNALSTQIGAIFVVVSFHVLVSEGDKTKQEGNREQENML